MADKGKQKAQEKPPLHTPQGPIFDIEILGMHIYGSTYMDVPLPRQYNDVPEEVKKLRRNRMLQSIF